MCDECFIINEIFKLTLHTPLDIRSIITDRCFFFYIVVLCSKPGDSRKDKINNDLNKSANEVTQVSTFFFFKSKYVGVLLCRYFYYYLLLGREGGITCSI